jgi:hypothetical protein
MSIGKHVAGVAIALCLVVGGVTSAVAAEKSSVPTDGNGEFDGANFTCLNYTNGLGDNATTKMQSTLAHLWLQGYLAGVYKAKGTLELSEDPNDEVKLSALLLQRCRDLPSFTILGVALQVIAAEPHKLPAKTIAEFSPATHTCGQQIEARHGSAGDATRADLADLWTFAFIQGFKNATQPDLVIPIENKKVLIGAVANACAKNPDMALLDMAAAVAERVKLQ